MNLAILIVNSETKCR